MIDPVTNLLEIAAYEPQVKQALDKLGELVTKGLQVKTSQEAADLFENNWLSRYPRPNKCVHDNGPEFVGMEFWNLLADAGIRNTRVSSYTPTANAIIEAVHKTVGQVIRTLVHLKPPQDEHEAKRLVKQALATAMHATRCAAHGSLNNYSPGTLAFHRDMFLDIPVIADLINIRDVRQRKIDMRLLRANSSRSNYDYKVGDNVYVAKPRTPGDKAQLMYKGPFPIIRVHTNNTVTMLDGQIQERISIRRLKLKR